MNIVNKLTLRHLKLNKKRTLVTIIGIIISVAMITAVSTLSSSFMDLMARQEIATDGEWHVTYLNANKEQIKAIRNDENTKELILNKKVGYGVLEGSQNKNKPYLYIEEYNKIGFKNFPIKLKEGRLPENSNELVISDAIITNGKVDYKIGDSITVDVGQRKSISGKTSGELLMQNYSLLKEAGKVDEELTKESSKNYTIVGIIERPNFEPTWSPGFSAFSYVNEEAINTKGTINAAITLKKINNKLFDKAKKLADENGIASDNIGYNSELLRYYGVIKDDGLKGGVLKLSAIIMGIIAIGSISLIYNAFAISVSERSRHLGMLSSVGATKKQKRNSVFFEGFVLGAISIPIGIFSGLIGMGITFLCVNPIMKNSSNISEEFRLVASLPSISAAIVISAITIFISTYIPARRASNISAIEAIRQTTDVKLTRKNVKTSKLTGKLFGIEGDIALKNLKRNKKRYKATVFSLVISIVLFLSVDFFNGYLKKSIVMTQDGVNYDISIKMYNIDEEMKKNIIRNTTSLENITSASYMETINVDALIGEASTADFIKEQGESYARKDGKYIYQVEISAPDDKTLEEYSKEVGADYNKLKNTEKLTGIVIDTLKYKDENQKKYIETKILKTNIGEKLNLITNMSENKEEALGDVEVAALTNKFPMGVTFQGPTATFNLIVSKDVLNKIIERNSMLKEYIHTGLFLNTDDALKVQEKIESIVDSENNNGIYVYNVFMQKEKEEQMILLLSVFEYGFIVLITLISVANIFNTISTSITLRKREFAMLKSVGMTPKGFNKMINYESIFYGIKALIYGLPISFIAMYLIYKSLTESFEFDFTIHWISVLVAVFSVFFVVGATMVYSSSKIRKENIIDALKQEII